jgi:NAD(P)-dependent dehydrogenase (short-subunit alcohol dehydrogenase family)
VRAGSDCGPLASKVRLITGSSRGLGRALAEEALVAGHRVVATARDPARLVDLAATHGERMLLLQMDVTDEPAVAHAFVRALDAFGRIDVVVNNAGSGDVAPIEDTSIEEFRAQIETNLFGTIIVTKAAIPVMRRQGCGHIIQFSSIGGRVGAVGRAPYCTTKWGVEGFSEVLAREMGPLGIRVTIVEPGGFRTDSAGVSTSIRAGRSEYVSTVGAMARFQQGYNGRQPGDPARAASVILGIANLSHPPLRLLLGTDAVRAAEDADQSRLAADRIWRHLSVSTDFRPADQGDIDD